VLWLFRAICVLLLLPFMTAAATPDRLPGETAVASLESLHGFAETRTAGAIARLASPQVKRVIAEVEDGPEGEEAPTFGLLRAYVGDDVAPTVQHFVRIVFDCSHAIPIEQCAAPARFAIPYNGFPTGPPAA